MLDVFLHGCMLYIFKFKVSNNKRSHLFSDKFHSSLYFNWNLIDNFHNDQSAMCVFVKMLILALIHDCQYFWGILKCKSNVTQHFDTHVITNYGY